MSCFNLIGVASGDLGTYATLGNPNKQDIWGVIKAVLKKNNANIISQPFLTANNNHKCVVEVTEKRRVSGKINDPSKTGGARTRDVVDMPAKTSVTLTRRINTE